MPRNPPLLDALFSQIEREGRRREDGGRVAGQAGAIRSMLMPHQAALVNDQARHVAVRSARRTGKTTGLLYMTAIRCLETPGSRWLVICQTRTSEAMRTYTQGIQSLNASFELAGNFHKQAFIFTLPNGSEIRFVGADNLSEIRKFRGGQFDGVVMDECAAMAEDLGVAGVDELIQEVLEPLLMDRNGTLYLVGTPGDVLAGAFYLATAETPVLLELPNGDKRLSNLPAGAPPGEHPAQYSLHAWALVANTTKFKDRHGNEYTLWDKALEVKAFRGYTDDDPAWRREYLGHWVADDGKVVYRYRPHLHDYRPDGEGPYGLPGTPRDKWRRVIGFDFGTRDGTTMVVWAFSDTAPGLWELYSGKRRADPGQKLTVREIAEWYREVEADFGPFEGWPADFAGLATMVMDTLADEYGVFLEPAEKKEKLDHIQLFNADLDARLIHLRKGGELGKEMLGNRWDPKTLGKDKRVENPETPNDLCDAALYAFRWCRHRQAKPKMDGPAYGTPAWWAQVTERDLAAARDEARRTRHDDPADRLDAEWWTERTPA